MKKPVKLYALFLMFIFCTFCKGQTKTILPTDTSKSKGLISPYGPTSSVRTIIQDRQGNIWGSGSVNGKWALFRFDEKSLSNKKPTVIEITESLNLFGIFEANDGNIWFGSFDGVYRYDGKTITNFKNNEGQK